MINRRASQPERPVSRGLTLLEFMIAILITSFIAVTMGGMITAVARSIESDRFNRESVVRGQALAARLGSYITPSLCVLDASAKPESIVMWLEDSRASNTVHLTEIRWIERDSATDTVVVHYVAFPESMSQLERDALDVEVPVASADWWAVLTTMQGLGYTEDVRLCDQVTAFTINHSAVSAQARKMVTAQITLAPEIGGDTLITAASIRELQEPSS